LLPSPLSQATEGDSDDEKRARTFALENQAPVAQQHSGPPKRSPLETKTIRDDTLVVKNATNVAGATHFYIALGVEFHYKLTPGTFAGITGSRMTNMPVETKEIFSCLTHMMTKELRGSSAGAACTQIV
jgi:hypothetical protein